MNRCPVNAMPSTYHLLAFTLMHLACRSMLAQVYCINGMCFVNATAKSKLPCAQLNDMGTQHFANEVQQTQTVVLQETVPHDTAY